VTESQVPGTSRVQGADQGLPKRPCRVETGLPAWTEESCGDRVWHAEGAVQWELELTKAPGTTTRTAPQGDPAYCESTQLSGACREVTFHTEPIHW